MREILEFCEIRIISPVDCLAINISPTSNSKKGFKVKSFGKMTAIFISYWKWTTKEVFVRRDRALLGFCRNNNMEESK